MNRRRFPDLRRQATGDPRLPRGFTFVEVMIAASILVVALLGIAAVLPTADMSLHQSGQVSKAVSLAQEMIEMIKTPWILFKSVFQKER